MIIIKIIHRLYLLYFYPVKRERETLGSEVFPNSNQDLSLQWLAIPYFPISYSKIILSHYLLLHTKPYFHSWFCLYTIRKIYALKLTFFFCLFIITALIFFFFWGDNNYTWIDTTKRMGYSVFFLATFTKTRL